MILSNIFLSHSPEGRGAIAGDDRAGEGMWALCLMKRGDLTIKNGDPTMKTCVLTHQKEGVQHETCEV